MTAVNLPGNSVVTRAVRYVVAVMMFTAVLVACSSSSSGNEVALENAGDLGIDPFGDQVETSQVATFTREVGAQQTQPDSFVQGEEHDTAVVEATTPGLYGGSGADTVCDVAGLIAFLESDAEKAAAWAEVLGVEPDAIAATIESYTPVVLTSDTVVTNHGFSGGRAVPRRSVLQAGTAVLVDEFGVPVVRCACGNPLLPGEPFDSTEVEFTGTPWSDFTANPVVYVQPAGAALDAITVVELQSGELVNQPTGSVSAGAYIATIAPQEWEYDLEGGIYYSEDGVDWSVALSGPSLLDVAIGGGLAVAVGSRLEAGGYIYTSTDGRNWNGPIDIPDPLLSVAYGDGAWRAVGTAAFSEVTDGIRPAVVYESDDGVTWNRTAVVEPPLASELGGPFDLLALSLSSLAYGDGIWLSSAVECNYRHCEYSQFRSDDGHSWSQLPIDERIVLQDLAFDGNVWGWLGGERTPGEPASQADIDKPIGAAGTSTDGINWSLEPTSPDRLVLRGLSASPDGWLAVQAPVHGSAPVPADGGFYTSTDLVNWQRVSTIVPAASSVARF